MEKKVTIVIRELNFIPSAICLDLNDYSKIIFQLVSNALKNTKQSNMMLIDISYFEIRDVESSHRLSSKKDVRASHSSSLLL